MLEPVEMTSTPALAAFLMLRRHCWFIPASTSSSVRPASGTWKLYCGWPAAKPPLTDCGNQPSARSWETTRAPVVLRSVGGTSSSERVASSAMPSFTCCAVHRRVTTGGPIRIPNAPRALRCAAIGSNHAPRSSVSQSMTGPSGR